jgi:hypothetical protein
MARVHVCKYIKKGKKYEEPAVIEAEVSLAGI